MKLEGIHHITAITGDAQRNVDFYAGTLGLRMVKKTVNQDAPSVYHLFYADEQGEPGLRHHLLRVPRRAARAAPAPGWSTGSSGGSARPRRSTSGPSGWPRPGHDSERDGDGLRFADPEGLEHELVVATVDDQPLIADHPEVPAELALQGFHAARAYCRRPRAQRRRCSRALEFERTDEGWEARGDDRGGLWSYDEPPAERGIEGAGTVHHIAWASEMDEHLAWRERAIAGGAHPTPVIDRFWFRVDLLPRAERRAVRDRDARARASASTRIPSTSARS